MNKKPRFVCLICGCEVSLGVSRWIHIDIKKAFGDWNPHRAQVK